jgi:hypothetical protein
VLRMDLSDGFIREGKSAAKIEAKVRLPIEEIDVDPTPLPVVARTQLKQESGTRHGGGPSPAQRGKPSRGQLHSQLP